MTYDPVPALARFAGCRGIAYPLLSDPDSEIIRAFGVLDARYAPGHPGHGIARPTIFVVDREGVVRHRFAEPDYRRRPEIDDVLAAIAGR